MAIYITLNSGNFTIPEFGGRTLISPLVDYDLSQEFDEDEIRRSSTIQTAINEGAITLKDSEFNIINNLNDLQASAKSINGENVGYNPSVLGNWDTIIPALLSDGLDQLASRVRFIEDNPTPGTVTSISAGTGMNFTTITTTGSVEIDISKVPYYSTGFSTGLAKWNGAAWTFDTNTYLTSNQTITISGDVTGSGTTSIATSISNETVTGKLLTGYVSGAGTITATDSILSAIQKLNGNISTLVTGVSSVNGSTGSVTITVTGTSNRISVTNGTGTTPTIDIAAAYVGQTSITTLGTVTAGTWNANIISGQYGGTGVNNDGRTITIAGNLTTSGAFNLTLTTTNTTNVTLPTTGTLATLAGPETLTNKTINGTNNTITNVSLNTAVTDTLPIANGGTGQTTANAALNALLPPQSGNTGKYLLTNGTNTLWVKNATPYQLNPSDPATTTSTSGVMMGLAASFTPSGTGNILIIISGDVDNSTANSNGSQIQIRTGSGTAPTNGSALTGTPRGSLIKYLNTSGNNGVSRIPFTLNSVVTGLSTGTQYWIDISLASIVGGTSRVRDLSVSIIEI